MKRIYKVFSGDDLRRNLFYSFILLSLLLVHPSAFAQDEDGRTMTYGAKVGYVHGTLLQANEKPLQRQGGFTAGFAIGGFFQYQLLDFLAIAPEVNYVNTAVRRLEGSANGFFNPSFGNHSVRFHNIDIPVLAAISLPFGGDITPRVIAGPAMMFNLKAYSKGEYSIGDNVFNTYNDVSNNYQSMEFGGVLGIGAAMDTDGFYYTLDIRYRHGFSKFNTNADTPIRTSMFSIMLGIGF